MENPSTASFSTRANRLRRSAHLLPAEAATAMNLRADIIEQEDIEMRGRADRLIAVTRNIVVQTKKVIDQTRRAVQSSRSR